MFVVLILQTSTMTCRKNKATEDHVVPVTIKAAEAVAKETTHRELRDTTTDHADHVTVAAPAVHHHLSKAKDPETHPDLIMVNAKEA